MVLGLPSLYFVLKDGRRKSVISFRERFPLTPKKPGTQYRRDAY